MGVPLGPERAHAALARYYDEKRLGEVTSHEQLVQTFKDAWDAKAKGPVPLQPVDEDEPSDPTDLAARMLGAFKTNADATQGHWEPLGVELPFALTLHDPDTGEVQEEKLVGVLDLVVRDGERLTVVEHKTAARKYTADQLAYDIQPTAYQLGVRETAGVEDVGLLYQVCTKAKVPAVQVEQVFRDSGAEDDFRRVALGVLKAIDAGVSYPVRGWQCRSCPYASACAARRAS